MAGLTFFLARSLGAVEQGLFFSIKATFDLLVACFVFGFPQSYVFEINSRKVSRNSLYRLTIYYSLFVLVILSIVLFSWKPHFVRSFGDMLVISFGVSFTVVASLVRAIYITVDDGPRYSLMTTVPTLFLVLTCLLFVAIFNNVSRHVSLIFFLSASGYAWVTYLLAHPQKTFLLEGNKPSSRKLLTLGLDAFLLSLSAIGQIFLTYQYLKVYAVQTDLGFFSVGLTVSNILSFPLQVISPMLLNRWSVRSPGLSRAGFRLPLKPLAAATALIGAIFIVMIVLPKAIWIILGAEYLPAISMIQIMVAYTAVAAIQRIASLRLSAVGQMRYGAVISICKFAFLALGLYTLSNQTGFQERAGEAACVLWLISELMAAVVTVRKCNSDLIGI
jgi:O-antigen/teichoic acid export membrane protein